MNIPRIAGAALLTLAFAICITSHVYASPPDTSHHQAMSDRTTPEHPMVAATHGPTFPPDPNERKAAVLLGLLALGAVPFLFGALVITTIRTPNAPLPVNSYEANIAFLATDAGPAVLPLPAAFAAKLANYGGTGVPATNAQLQFVITPIALGAAAGGFTASYDGAGNLDIAHATGANTGATLYVKVSIPSTNNQP